MKYDIYNPPIRCDLIAADPPWQYGSRGARSGRHGELDYPTMTVDEICALPVANVAADTAILQLWFTGAVVHFVVELDRLTAVTPWIRHGGERIAPSVRQ